MFVRFNQVVFMNQVTNKIDSSDSGQSQLVAALGMVKFNSELSVLLQFSLKY